MPKLKEFLQKTFEQGDVRGDDVAALLGASSLAELEIPEAAVTKFNEAYLTRTRAENDPEIIKKIKTSSRAEILDGVDRELEKIYPLIDSTKAGDIQKNQSTFKKIELLSEALGETIKNGKSNVDKSIQKIEEEWSKKFKDATEGHKLELAQVKKVNEENNLNFVLKSKLYNFELADSFKEMKDSVVEVVIGKIKGHRTKEGNPIILELDSTGSLNVRQQIEGTLRDVYADGNDKLTIDKLIAPFVDPFVKKSAGGSGGSGQSTKPKIQTQPVDHTKATLSELRQTVAQ